MKQVFQNDQIFLVLSLGFMFSFASPLFAQQLDDSFLLRDLFTQEELEKTYGDKGLRENEIAEIFQNFENKLLVKAYQRIKRAKVFILNGNTKKARRELEKVDFKDELVSVLRDRFLALVEFLEGRYENSFQILDNKYFTNSLFYKQICLLQMANLVALKKFQLLAGETLKCQSFLSASDKVDFLWPNNLADILNKRQLILRGDTISSITPYRTSLKDTKLWLKLALFLNKEKLILPEIELIPGEFFNSQSLRELLGFVFYRADQPAKALSFVEDLETANAENIKGNIHLFQNKYELAYGHFQLALKNKANSRNAIERALPLSWKLKKWEEGLRLTTKLFDEESSALTTQRKKQALKVAYLTQMDKPFLAFNELLKTNELFRDLLPLEIEQLHAYNAFIMNDEERAENYTNLACQKFDGLNCWLQFQMSLWEDFRKTVDRDEEVQASREFTPEKLKTNVIVKPLIEEKYVDQKDIEELDDQFVPLINENSFTQ